MIQEILSDLVGENVVMNSVWRHSIEFKGREVPAVIRAVTVIGEITYGGIRFHFLVEVLNDESGHRVLFPATYEDFRIARQGEQHEVPIETLINGESTCKSLRLAGIETISQLLGASDWDLLQISGIGKKKIRSIQSALQNYKIQSRRDRVAARTDSLRRGAR